MRNTIANYLKLSGFIIAVVSYSVYYNIAVDLWPNQPDWMFNILFRDSFFLSLSFVAFGFGLTEGSKLKKFLIYYPTGFYFAWMLVVYFLNENFDDLIDMNKTVFVTSAAICSCFVLFCLRPKK